MFLGYMLFPATEKVRREPASLFRLDPGHAGAFCAAYLFLFYAELAARPGRAGTTPDPAVALVGATLLLGSNAPRRGFADGNHGGRFPRLYFSRPVHADMIAHKGASFNKGMTHHVCRPKAFWRGPWRVVRICFSLFFSGPCSIPVVQEITSSSPHSLGHMRGGPAKAAVVSSRSDRAYFLGSP